MEGDEGQADPGHDPESSARPTPVRDRVDEGLEVVVGAARQVVGEGEDGVERGVDQGVDGVVEPPRPAGSSVFSLFSYLWC